MCNIGRKKIIFNSHVAKTNVLCMIFKRVGFGQYRIRQTNSKLFWAWIILLTFLCKIKEYKKNVGSGSYVDYDLRSY